MNICSFPTPGRGVKLISNVQYNLYPINFYGIVVRSRRTFIPFETPLWINTVYLINNSKT